MSKVLKIVTLLAIGLILSILLFVNALLDLSHIEVSKIPPDTETTSGIVNATVVENTSTTDTNILETEETVTDIDGNIYKTIKIGTQVWMSENLKTTNYNDGEPIQLVDNNSAWGNLKTPGYSMNYDGIDVKKWGVNKTYGRSIRCIKDDPLIDSSGN